ncbi:hypothetical protein [Klebsiella pneumoniae]|uniref:hypothetical protein n=1 Tax=Klebsiella pneumoniae TaxID=573 RepID=UPI002730C1EC|nr:hypothetical protein [Klebsiella pneumoniae]MDP0891517.1 hypothetical protein [Klebsiella pneumoniae]
MNMAEEVHHAPNLKRSKYFATMALIIVVVLWIGLLIANRFLPEYTDLIHILMLVILCLVVVNMIYLI